MTDHTPDAATRRRWRELIGCPSPSRCRAERVFDELTAAVRQRDARIAELEEKVLHWKAAYGDLKDRYSGLTEEY